ncbi:unnamed protein product [Strongylus vulgaris]|uniref:N-acetylgalactosaminide beta-1,3-galactosyltransferase n=1 Tax=Strongylus vulgaris TaxID=40348 RepID=A0A3P7II86_STRVU|nr:unnamed protein product [Strongylus vulgaris]
MTYEQASHGSIQNLAEPTSGLLYDDVRVFCWVATHPKNHKTKARAVAETWGPLCNQIVFVSNATDDSLPVIVVNLTESRNELWRKTREAFKWIYNNVLTDYDWFLKADDDTYMHMDNLRALLVVNINIWNSLAISARREKDEKNEDSIRGYSPDEPIAIGHQFTKDCPDYHSGGAGYVLSKEAVRRLVGEGFAKLTSCNKRNPFEDVFLGLCLNKTNVTITDGADENGAYRLTDGFIMLYSFILRIYNAIYNSDIKK